MQPRTLLCLIWKSLQPASRPCAITCAWMGHATVSVVRIVKVWVGYPRHLPRFPPLRPDNIEARSGVRRTVMRAVEIFTPGAFPQYTYVERRDERLEATLANALSVPGQIVSLAGPSKSGKTVLVERVVGKDNLIPISGASIKTVDDVWTRIFEWMGSPESSSETATKQTSVGLDVSAKGAVGLPMLAKVELGSVGHLAGGFSNATQVVHKRQGLAQIVKEIGNSDFVVLLDDFHYMTDEVQAEVAKALKEAVR